MILLRTNILRFYHFARPTLSNLSSLGELEQLMQQRLLSSVKQVNANTLKHYSLIDTIQEKLVLENTLAKQIPHRSINISVIDPRTHTHHITQVRLDENLQKLKLEPSQFGLPFAEAGEELVHFSEKRGVATFQELNQYQIDDRILLIFNLPENVSQQDIQVKLKQKNCKITFKYCILGLPAYVRVQFQSVDILQRCLQRFQNKKLEFGDRSPVVKTQKDLERLKLANRQLVININQDAKFEKMVVDLSRYGRVMHIDWPLEAYINPTLEQVKQAHKNSRDLIKINIHNIDGTIDSQYFPDIRAWKQNQDEREVMNIMQKMEDLKDSYQNRARFARNIDIFAGHQHQLILRNRGYFTVTYSTSQESQNYYFAQGGRTPLDLVGRKQEFQFDPIFKKELLRRIDNEYLIGKKNDFGRKQAQIPRKDEEQVVKKNTYNMSKYQLNHGRGFQSYYIFQRIVADRYYKEAMTKNSQYKDFKILEGYNEFMEWEQHLRTMRRAKDQYKFKTFDEMAEQQLYGRVLPKDDTIQKIKFQNVKFGNSEQFKLIQKHGLMTEPNAVKNRNMFYLRQRERNNRMTDEYLGINHNHNQNQSTTQETGEHTQGEVPATEDGENIGKQGFSTARPAILYRNRTAQEAAQYRKRYNQFVRTNIYEYMGIFQDQLLEQTIASKPEVLNPQSLKFLDGSSYLTESELTDVLQFRRDFKRAQQDYESYVIGNEYIKSANINVNSLTANFKAFQKQALQQLVDVGLVEETRKVQGSQDQLKKKANILNTEVAQFGQEYKLEILNDQKYLVKIRKLQHLTPIDRIAHLERVVQEIDHTITPEQAAVFQKNYKIMKQTGNIPSEVRKAFRIDEKINVSDLMSEMGLIYNVTKKDLQMTQRMKEYSKQEINDDISNQYSIEQQRRHKRKINSEDFSKDPSQIYVKDREGYFKVSRYRQI